MTSVRDIIIIAVLLFAVGISILMVVKVSHQVNVKLLLTPTFANDTNAVNVITHSDAALNSTDYMYLAAFIGFFLAIIITGYFVSGVPIAAPIYFFIVIFFVFVSIILQTVYVDIGSSSSFLSATVSLPITNFILLHLGYFMTIFGLVGILVMFAKPTQVNI